MTAPGVATPVEGGPLPKDAPVAPLVLRLGPRSCVCEVAPCAAVPSPVP